MCLSGGSVTIARVGSGQLPTRGHTPRTDCVLAVEWPLGRGPRCPDPPVSQGAVGLVLGMERGQAGARHSHPGGHRGRRRKGRAGSTCTACVEAGPSAPAVGRCRSSGAQVGSRKVSKLRRFKVQQ